MNKLTEQQKENYNKIMVLIDEQIKVCDEIIKEYQREVENGQFI
ncbi:MAG: hypothetical protein NT076_05000 [Candidatus Pacearchaeota archaeon]|nr:hypothetical protein [Candidatus Pacearchaeota archaeon]